MRDCHSGMQPACGDPTGKPSSRPHSFLPCILLRHYWLNPPPPGTRGSHRAGDLLLRATWTFLPGRE